MRNVLDKSRRENYNTHFMLNNVFRKSRHLWEDVEKYLLLFSVATVVSRTRLSVTLILTLSLLLKWFHFKFYIYILYLYLYSNVFHLDTLGWNAVVFCACEIIQLLFVLLYLLRAVCTLDFRLVIMKTPNKWWPVEIRSYSVRASYFWHDLCRSSAFAWVKDITSGDLEARVAGEKPRSMWISTSRGDGGRLGHMNIWWARIRVCVGLWGGGCSRRDFVIHRDYVYCNWKSVHEYKCGEEHIRTQDSGTNVTKMKSA
jgi:hypothetical protein